MGDLQELKQKIKNIEINYNYNEVYLDLYNACIDYMNNTQSWDFECLFEDIIDYDYAEEMAKWELEQGGLIRLYYFLGDANLNNDLFRIDGYGNLTDINKEDLEDLQQEILDMIEDLENKEEE